MHSKLTSADSPDKAIEVQCVLASTHIRGPWYSQRKSVRESIAPAEPRLSDFDEKHIAGSEAYEDYQRFLKNGADPNGKTIFAVG